MHLTARSPWSRSVGTGGRDESERVAASTGMRGPEHAGAINSVHFGCDGVQSLYASMRSQNYFKFEACQTT